MASFPSNLRISISSSSIVIESTFNDPSTLSHNLVISRNSFSIRKNIQISESYESIINCYGIIGIISLFNSKYLILVENKVKIGSILNADIYQLKKIKIINIHTEPTSNKIELEYLKSIEDLFSTEKLYFSHEYNFSNEYFNFIFNSQLIDKIPEEYTVKLISGFVEITSFPSFQFVLISKRAINRIGTRYFSRGADREGNVSNFVETSQILISGGGANSPARVFHLTQTRGSIPLFWQQKITIKYQPKMIVSRDSGDVMRRHFELFKAAYNPETYYVINLINSDGYEGKLNRQFGSDIKRIKDDGRLKYRAFDFHHECRKFHWENIRLKLIEEIKDEIDYTVDNTRIQRFMIRTNCIDCLDRTNVVQSEIGRFAIEKQFLELGITPPESFWFTFKNVWADNADALSEMYSGTGALKTDFTRTGKRTLAGALQDLFNSIMRYLKNHFVDGKRQDAFDLVTGKVELNSVTWSVIKENFNVPIAAQLRFYMIPVFILLSALSAINQLSDGSFIGFVMWLSLAYVGLRLVGYYYMDFVDIPLLVDCYPRLEEADNQLGEIVSSKFD